MKASQISCRNIPNGPEAQRTDICRSWLRPDAHTRINVIDTTRRMVHITSDTGMQGWLWGKHGNLDVDIEVLLILSTGESPALSDFAFDLGFAPKLRSIVPEALEVLRREHCVAVVIDRQDLDVDVLEFVLSARKLDNHVPVFVLGRCPGKGDDAIVEADQRTFMLDAGSGLGMLAEHIEALVAQR